MLTLEGELVYRRILAHSHVDEHGGRPRVADGNADGASRVDIGAYELHPE